MDKYTELEKQVFNALLDITHSDYCAYLSDLRDQTGLNLDTLKGVIGSLTKKGIVITEKDEDTRKQNIFPWINVHSEYRVGSYLCDVIPSLNELMGLYSL